MWFIIRGLGPVSGLMLGLIALSACAPTIPDSAAGVGFEDYGTFMRNREAQARGATPARSIVPPPQVHSLPARPEPAAAGGDPSARAIAAEALASVAPDRARATSDPLPLPGGADGWGGSDSWSTAPAEPAPAPGAVAAGPEPLPAGSATIYQDAVLDMDTARATRDAERERFEQRRAQFRVIEPTALPERPTDATNIVAYALRTTNRVGEQRFRRSRLTTQNHARNCAQFVNADLAQEEFLRQGGPDRDPLNLDPDGDGFACWWDPEPFRAAARAAN